MTLIDLLGLLGIIIAVGLLILLAFHGFSLLLAAPAVALLAAAFSGQPLLANLTQAYMPGVGRFIVQFFPIFLCGALFGKLMDDSGAARAIAQGFTDRLGSGRAILAVVLACALLTYGGVSLFVVSFAVYPIAAALFRQADIPHRLIPAAITLGAFTFTMTALPGTPAIQNAIPMPHFGTTLFAAPGIGLIAALVMLGCGMWWLERAARLARQAGQGYGRADASDLAPHYSDADLSRERAVNASAFDPAELAHGQRAAHNPSFALALLPILVVMAVNLLMTWVVLPHIDTGFLSEPRWGNVSLAAVSGIWSVVTALVAATLVLILTNRARLPALRQSLDAGANAAVLPVFNTASLAGFGAVVAALPVFASVSDALLAVPGGPLVSLSVAASTMGIITGSASAALTITLDAFGPALAQTAALAGIDPALMHRIASLACGPLSMLPHSGAIITLLGICGATQKQSFGHIGIVTVIGPLLGLIVAILLGSLFGAF